MRTKTIWTDGSCLGNPGFGGWSAIFFHSAFGQDYPTPYLRAFGSEIQTTNNRMEMKAIIEALRGINPGSHARIVTDSSYCAEGATRWHKKWIDRKWKGVANIDLWHELLDVIGTHKLVEFQVVKGHSKIHWNEECDAIAKTAAKARRETDELGLTTRFDRLTKRIVEGGIFDAELAR